MAGAGARAAGEGVPGRVVVAAEHLIAAGVDGCRGGWIAALDYGSRTELERFSTAADLVAWREARPERPVVAIDIPIGLPQRVGYRACDNQARQILGRRRSCVFQAADREMFGLAFAEVQELVERRRRDDPAARGLSRQGHGIMAKIAEVDALVREATACQQWLVESHPEVGFRCLAGRDMPPKKSAGGRAARLVVLAREFPDVEERVAAAPWPRREVGLDDILDAYVNLWTARRFARRAPECRVLGSDERDDHGVLMRIVV